jgi:hypothetical protein
MHPIVNGDSFLFSERSREKKGPPKKYGLRTKQVCLLVIVIIKRLLKGDLLNDLIHEWFAEYKKQKTEIEETKLRQSSMYQSSESVESVNHA